MRMVLDRFWSNHSCLKLNPCRKAIGAATFHPKTIKYIINNSSLSFCFLQSTNRPYDSSFGLNHKLQRYLQYQVLIQPFHGLAGSLCFKSLQRIGLTNHMIFRRSYWGSTTLNAWGAGWECLAGSVEICQITMFHQICGLKLNHPILEITYGLERLELVVVSIRRLVDRSEVLDCYVNTRLINCHNVLMVCSKVRNQLTNGVNSNFYSRYFMFLKLIEMYNHLTTSWKLKRTLVRCVLNKVQGCIRFVVDDFNRS